MCFAPPVIQPLRVVSPQQPNAVQAAAAGSISYIRKQQHFNNPYAIAAAQQQQQQQQQSTQNPYAYSGTAATAQQNTIYPQSNGVVMPPMWMYSQIHQPKFAVQTPNSHQARVATPPNTSPKNAAQQQKYRHNKRRAAHKKRKRSPPAVTSSQSMVEFGKEKKPSGVIPCKFFMKNNGRCKFGSNCRFSHVHCYPLPKSFSEDPIAQAHVKESMQRIKKQEEQERRSAAQESSKKENTTPSSDKATIERLSASVVAFDWQTSFSQDDLVFREAVHYSSESADAPRSKMCNKIQQILQESEEYQRLETICTRETKKQKGEIKFSPAFVDGDLIIQVSMPRSALNSNNESSLNIPECIEGIKCKVVVELR